MVKCTDIGRSGCRAVAAAVTLRHARIAAMRGRSNGRRLADTAGPLLELLGQVQEALDDTTTVLSSTQQA